MVGLMEGSWRIQSATHSCYHVTILHEAIQAMADSPPLLRLFICVRVEKTVSSEHMLFWFLSYFR